MTSDAPAGPKTAPPATRYALVSIGAAIVTISLKLVAYALTGSVGLFSDAAESFANLLAALVAYWALTVSGRPADPEHAFGHTKAEYFASGFEAIMILTAALWIGVTAVERLGSPQALTQVWLGLAVSTVASAVNGGVAWVLFRAGKRLDSITLRADAHHLLTDVWTSAGVLVGVVLVQVTGWLALDAIVALLVAVNIVGTALKLLVETGHGLLDRGLPAEERGRIDAILTGFGERGVAIHALKTRSAGPRRFVQMHVLVPGSWTVTQGHDVCEEIEAKLSAALPNASVLTHLEPIEDPAAWEDEGLDRGTARPG